MIGFHKSRRVDNMGGKRRINWGGVRKESAYKSTKRNREIFLSNIGTDLNEGESRRRTNRNERSPQNFHVRQKGKTRGNHYNPQKRERKLLEKRERENRATLPTSRSNQSRY